MFFSVLVRGMVLVSRWVCRCGLMYLSGWLLFSVVCVVRLVCSMWLVLLSSMMLWFSFFSIRFSYWLDSEVVVWCLWGWELGVWFVWVNLDIYIVVFFGLFL